MPYLNSPDDLVKYRYFYNVIATSIIGALIVKWIVILQSVCPLYIY